MMAPVVLSGLDTGAVAITGVCGRLGSAAGAPPFTDSARSSASIGARSPTVLPTWSTMRSICAVRGHARS